MVLPRIHVLVFIGTVQYLLYGEPLELACCYGIS